jgi:hypothetical protein
VVAANALAVPFLAIAAAGNLWLLVNLPEGEADLSIYLVVLPAAAAACLGILAVSAVQAWHWGAFVRNGRLAASTEETWRVTGRVTWALTAAIVALAFLGILLPAHPSEALEAGRTFGVTMRGHTQFLLLLLVPLAPLLGLQRAAAATLRQHQTHSRSLEVSGLHPDVLALYCAGGLAALAAGAATFVLEGALWAWMVALLPMAVLAARSRVPEGAVTLLTAAFILWGIGNTVTGSFSSTSGRLHLDTGGGALALWRLAGAILAGIAVFRLAAAAAPRDAPFRTWAASTAAVALGALLVLELPLAAWVVTRAEGQSVAIGSLLSGQALPVRITMHTIAALLSAAAAQAVARAWRPEWFGRMPPPLASPRRSKAPA